LGPDGSVNSDRTGDNRLSGLSQNPLKALGVSVCYHCRHSSGRRDRDYGIEKVKISLIMMLSKLILDLYNKLATVFYRVHPQAPKREDGKITLNQTSDAGWLDRRTGDQTELTETQA